MSVYKKIHILIRLEQDWVNEHPSDEPHIERLMREFALKEPEAALIRNSDSECEFETAYTDERRAALEKSIKAALRKALNVKAGDRAAKWEIFPLTEDTSYDEAKDDFPSEGVLTSGETAWHLELELDGDWVLKRRNDALLPIEDFMAAMLAEFQNIIPIRHSLTECEMVITASKKDEIDRAAKKALADMGAQKSVVRCETDEVILVPQPTISVANANSSEKESAQSIDLQQPMALQKIDELIGAQEFKALAHELALVAPRILAHHTEDIFLRRSYLFSVGDGCGLSTQLKLLMQLLKELELYDANKVVECACGDTLESMLEDSKSSGLPRIVCFELSEWMDKVTQPAFRSFLRTLWRRMEDQICVFRIPFVDDETLGKVRAALSDVFTVREVIESPGTMEEYFAYTEMQLKKKEFSLAAAARENLEQRLVEEKSDGRFYGFATVNKVTDELIYEKHRLSAEGLHDSDERVIGSECFEAAENAGFACPAMELLDQLVGIDGIKARIEEVLAQIEVANSSAESLQPCLNMRFVGNPGTGKTTVARIVGQLMRERGLLSKGQFFEYAGRDFCGQYIGETAPKTAAMCRDAYGSILFIDEAYSLYRGDKDNKDYGREAIDTLIAQMENHRNDFVVIMAGYPDDMTTLMDGNAGLASRMPYVLEFPNYTRRELCDIFMQMVSKAFPYEAALKESVTAYFESLSEEVLSSKEFANARFVRNLFERTWGKASVRSKLEPEKPFMLCGCDFDKAAADREFQNLQQKAPRRIGFQSR